MFKKAFLNSIPSGVVGFVLSFLAALLVIPMPETAIANAINNGVSGFLSGLAGASVTLIVFMKNLEKTKAPKD